MRFREKLLILFVAVVLSGLGFYLVSSPFVDLHMLAKKSHNETVGSYLVENDDDACRIRAIVDSSLQVSWLDFIAAILDLCASPAQVCESIVRNG